MSLAVGLILAVGFTRVVGQGEPTGLGMAKWLVVPAMIVSSLALIALDVPMTVRFEMSRAALEQSATQSGLGDGSVSGLGWIGLEPIDSIWREADGTVVFVVSQEQDFLGDPCGLAYNPDARPDQTEGHAGRELGHGWWTWCERM